jgi:hypothetical protein
MISETQLPQYLRDIIDDEVEIYKNGRSVQIVNTIPDTTGIPIENPKHWLKIQDVVCIFVDMKNSTKLSASNHDNSTAGAYQLFTGTAVKFFVHLNHRILMLEEMVYWRFLIQIKYTEQ